MLIGNFTEGIASVNRADLTERYLQLSLNWTHDVMKGIYYQIMNILDEVSLILYEGYQLINDEVWQR